MTYIQLQQQYPSRDFAIGLGIATAIVTATHQFVTNLHTVPITERTQVVALSREDEMEFGKLSFEEEVSSSKILESGSEVDAVKRIANRIIKVTEKLFHVNYDWEIQVIQNDETINAGCYPGGKIVVYTGMINLIQYLVDNGDCKSFDDALAVVLSHEIAHAVARHTAERMSLLPVDILMKLLDSTSPLMTKLWELVFSLPFSRIHETEADHIGLILMTYSCYEPKEAPRLWKGWSNLEKIEFGDFFSSHPLPSTRAMKLEELQNKATALKDRISWCDELEKDYISSIKNIN